MAEITPDLLQRPVRETARVLALQWLTEASAALERLADPNDAEALHDFRVSVRRLRATLRAYRPHLKGSSPKRMRRRLRKLASATNPARDAEVQIAWLRPRLGRLGVEERAGATALLSRLEQRRDASYAIASQQVAPEFRALQSALIDRLTFQKAEIARTPTGNESFLSVTAGLLREHAHELRAILDIVRSPEDEVEAHDARITAKRLRYLLEPMEGSVHGARQPIKSLKELQDILGDLHDSQVLDAELALALEAATRRAPRPHELTMPSAHSAGVEGVPGEINGLMELVRELREERAALFDRLRDGWFDDAPASFFQRLVRLAARMGQRAGAAPASSAGTS